MFRWKVFQPNDVLAECQRISLDPLDCVKEGTQLHIDDSFQQPNQNSMLESSISSLLRLNNIFHDPDKSHNYSISKKSDKSQSKLMQNASENICNPAEICHMTTPPSSRPISPSHSAHDLRSMSTRNPTSSDVEAGSECRGSIQSLNESDRKSLNGSHNFNNKSPSLMHKAVSSENVNKRSALLKSFMSSQSTPFEKERISNSRKSTPLSPKRSGSYKQPKNNRPTSSEFLKSRLGNSGNFDYHSAPTSPMIPPQNSTAVASSQFSFNTSDIVDESVTKGETPKFMPDKSRPESPYVQSDSIIDIKMSLKKLFEETNLASIPPGNRGDQSDFANMDGSYHQQQSLANSRSPVQILDDFIQFGTDMNTLLINKSEYFTISFSLFLTEILIKQLNDFPCDLCACSFNFFEK